MNWKNLKLNKCPQCDKDFTEMSFSKPEIISCFNCQFKIRPERMKEIISSKPIYKKESHYRPDDEIPDNYD